MSKGTIAAKHPALVRLEAGKTYAWCRCGLSHVQPFCDGSHRTTEFKPLKWTAEETRDVMLCQCKQTGNAPYCDGTHKTL